MLPDGCHWAFEDQKTALKRKIFKFNSSNIRLT